MAINSLTTANTFQEWLTTTSALVSTVNNLTDNTAGGFIANSSIYIEGSSASLNVRTLANINTLRANTANIANISMTSGSITGNGTITMRDANVWGNIVSVNTTGNLRVGGDAHIYGNLIISGNVTLDSIGFNDLEVAGFVNTIGLTVDTANITTLVGNANVAIYNTITAAIDSSIAFAIALG
jgi:hypothetical protein